MKKWLFFARPFSSRFADVAWLLFRLHLGLSIAVGAGWSKLVNLTTASEVSKLLTGAAALGPPDWFVQQVAQLGFVYPSPYVWAWLAAWGEFAGGLLVAVGLLTRWSGLQLALQFLIIAFLWYDSPEPLLGMYYQQLLFWAFVLVAMVGGGRYSLDYFLIRPQHSHSQGDAGTLKPALLLLLLLLLGNGDVCAQSATPRLTMQELARLAQQWERGSLTYLDYSSRKSVTLPTYLNGMRPRSNELVLDFVYQEPEGKQVEGYDKLILDDTGTKLEWDGVPMVLVEKTPLPNQTLRLKFEGIGQDDQRDCLIRRTLLLGPQQILVVKEVKYVGSSTFLVRNTYRFQR
ncbi:DoxX family protein [Hymenobacter sediminicola]|uniref:DoxX family protein n=1 Tax=Hymenobacter sediminicola TaxID=2761579 RepID=A0A7G7W3E5_9BACT|nr:DoxX family protein [Hymenobacter sediminicola]QNH60888.1 DoxX family protein [Hymenobacter sediminicola]